MSDPSRLSQPDLVVDGGDLPSGLLEAFDAYEAALAASDQEALAAAFEPGDATLRADAGGLLVGHEEITAFRGRRAEGRERRIVSRHVRVVDDSVALVTSVNAPGAGGRGVVTQLWRLSGEGVWRIAVAQVQSPGPAVDTRIWRIVGSPLVASPARPEGVEPQSGRDAAPRHGSTAETGFDTSALPLAGETVAVKDLFAVAGFAIGGGVPAYLSTSPVADFHAPAVQALLDAGSTVLGIAQTDEFAYSIAGRNSAYGTPPNAVVPGGIPGGSSSGPASAVALGQTSIGLGTDTGGSIRVPASYQALWGLRTTHGAVRRTDLLPLAPTFDAVGWLTREPGLLRRAAEATLVGTAAHGRVQRGVDADFVTDPRLVASVQPAVHEAFAGAVSSLPGGLAEVALGDIAHLYELFRIVQAAEAWGVHGAWITAHPGALAPDVAQRFAFGSTVTSAQEDAARDEIAVQREHLDQVLEGRILVLPSTSSPAPSLSAPSAELDAVRSATLGLTCVAGVGGYPAVSAPLMTVPGGPVGLCFVGPRRSDLALVTIAETVAEAFAGPRSLHR